MMYINIIEEKWKDIQGFEGYYLISSKGRVMSLDRAIKRPGPRGNTKVRSRILKNRDNGRGYATVALHKNELRRYAKVHRLVAEAFVPNPDNCATVNHKDGNKANNCAENLEWCSFSDNTAHAIRTGIHNAAKERRAIVCIETGKTYQSIRAAALDLNVLPGSISNVLNGKSKTAKNLTFERVN
jgi:hypothetical protein